MDQVIQVVGSLLVLAAFIGAQRGWLAQTSVTYLGLNLLGSSVLAVLAAVGQQWGFLLLESVWALVSASSIAQQLRAQRVPASAR
jgi:hypothetical protein